MDYPTISTSTTTESPEPTEQSSATFTLPVEAIYGIFVVILVILAAVVVLKLRKH